MCGAGIRLPRFGRLLQIDETLREISSEGLRRLPVCRHVDAARFHYDGIHQAVDALEIDGATDRAVEGRVIAPRILECPEREDNSQDGKHSKKHDQGIEAGLQAMAGQPSRRQSKIHEYLAPAFACTERSPLPL